MGKILFDVFEINIAVSIVILLVALLAEFLRKRYGAGWLRIVWILLAVRLLIPYNFSLPNTEIRLFNTPGFEQEMYTESYMNEEALLSDEIMSEADEFLSENDTDITENLPEQQMQSPTVQMEHGTNLTIDEENSDYNQAGKDVLLSEKPMNDVVEEQVETNALLYTGILLCVWGIGVIAFGTYYAFAYMWFQYRSRKKLCPILDEALRERIESIQLKYLSKVKCSVYESEAINTPMLMGIFAPKLVLPTDCSSAENNDKNKWIPTERWSDEELEMVVAHELCHYQNKDLWLKIIMLIACCINWFNPAVHYMKKQFFYDLELACDYRVLRNCNANEKQQYAEVLLKYAGKETSFSAGLSANKKRLKNRISHMWENEKKKNGIPAFILIAVLLSGVGLFISCGYKPEEVSDEPITEPNPVSDESVAEHNEEQYAENSMEQADEESVVYEESPLVVNIQDYYSTNIGDPSNLYHIDENKVLWGCGRNNCGQLGQGTQDYDFHEEPMKIAENVVHVDFSQHDFAIFLTEEGELYGIGTAATGVMKEYEEISTEMLINREHYIVSTPKLLMEDVIYASCGRDDIVCLLQDGSVWILGTVWWQGFGGDSYVAVEPEKILDDAVMVTGGLFNHAALLEDGSVWTWGYNYAGSCGVSGTKYVSEPVKVAEDVLMVWTGRTKYNSEYTNIADFNGEYEQFPENTIILKEDGSYWACGVGLGEETYLDRYWEVDDLYVVCSYEFVPVNSMNDL